MPNWHHICRDGFETRCNQSFQPFCANLSITEEDFGTICGVFINICFGKTTRFLKMIFGPVYGRGRFCSNFKQLYKEMSMARTGPLKPSRGPWIPARPGVCSCIAASGVTVSKCCTARVNIGIQEYPRYQTYHEHVQINCVHASDSLNVWRILIVMSNTNVAHITHRNVL